MFVYGGTLIPESSSSAGVRAIATADPTFAVDTFLALARSVHLEVHGAMARGDYISTSSSVHADLVAELAARRTSDDAWRSEVQQHDHVVIIEANHGEQDSIVVRFGARIAGRPVVEDWVFERTAVVHPHLRDARPAECTSCGAGLDVDGQGDCRYCGTHLLGAAGPWAVAAVPPLRLLDPALPTTAPSQLLRLQPPVDTGTFLAFAREVHRTVHEASAYDRLDTVGDVVTTEMRGYLASRPEELVWDEPVDEVLTASIVDARPGATDAIVVRFEALAGGMDFVEDWTFERPGGSEGPVRTTCSSCGAAIDLDERGSCRSCGTQLVGVAGPWRLAGAGLPETPMVTHPLVVRLMQRRGGQIALLVFLLAALVLAVVGIVALVTVE